MPASVWKKTFLDDISIYYEDRSLCLVPILGVSAAIEKPS